jgi:hypothetical protein
MAPPWALLVGRLGCLHGIAVLTAFGLAVEIGDWQRFTGARIGASRATPKPSSPAATVTSGRRELKPHAALTWVAGQPVQPGRRKAAILVCQFLGEVTA